MSTGVLSVCPSLLYKFSLDQRDKQYGAKIEFPRINDGNKGWKLKERLKTGKCCGRKKQPERNQLARKVNFDKLLSRELVRSYD